MKTKTRVANSYSILESLRLKNNLYLASSSNDYHYVWLRDSFYEVMPYLELDSDEYERTYHRILDILNDYAFKFNPIYMKKPDTVADYIHPRYCEEGKEIPVEWGNAQNDATGAILYGIAKGEKFGKKIIRNEVDRKTVQNLVWYLNTCRYWEDLDNGMWEENRELHMSSVGACLAGLYEIKGIVYVPDFLIEAGQVAISSLFPKESLTKDFDLAQLSLIYPYNLLSNVQTKIIVEQVENNLLRNAGVLRYIGDSYYNSALEDTRKLPNSFYVGKEAEWTMGIPWLALCYIRLGDQKKAEYYIRQAESLMLEGSKLPKLYYAHTRKENINNPLGWSNALYIMAVKEYEKVYGELKSEVIEEVANTIKEVAKEKDLELAGVSG